MGQSPDAPAHLRHNPGMQTAAELIRASIWARGLTSDELGRVESEVVERQVQAGAYVARKGDPVEHWIGVVSGLVKLSSVSPGGKTANFAGMNGGASSGKDLSLDRAVHDTGNKLLCCDDEHDDQRQGHYQRTTKDGRVAWVVSCVQL